MKTIRERVREELAQMLAESGQLMFYDRKLKILGCDAAFSVLYQGTRPVLQVGLNSDGEVQAPRFQGNLLHGLDDPTTPEATEVKGGDATSGDNDGGTVDMLGGAPSGDGNGGAAYVFGADAPGAGDGGWAFVLGGEADTGLGGQGRIAAGGSQSGDGGIMEVYGGASVSGAAGALQIAGGESPVHPGRTYIRTGTDGGPGPFATVYLHESLADPTGRNGFIQIQAGHDGAGGRGVIDIVGSLLNLATFTFATLPAVPSGVEGPICRISDADTNVLGAAITGSGSSPVIASWDRGSDDWFVVAALGSGAPSELDSLSY